MCNCSGFVNSMLVSCGCRKSRRQQMMEAQQKAHTDAHAANQAAGTAQLVEAGAGAVLSTPAVAPTPAIGV